MIQEPVNELMWYMCWRSGEDVIFGMGVRVKKQIEYEEQHSSTVFVVIVFICLCRPAREANVKLRTRVYKYSELGQLGFVVI